MTDGEPRSASMYDDFGKQLDGYNDAFAILDSLAVQLSSGAYRRRKDTLEPSVSDTRAL